MLILLFSVIKRVKTDFDEHLECEDDREDVVGNDQEVTFLYAQHNNIINIMS